MESYKSQLITILNDRDSSRNCGQEIDSAMGEMLLKVRQWEERQIEHLLRNRVTPTIKGEITKGKIKWRGLQVAYSSPSLGNVNWNSDTFKICCTSNLLGVTQRGVLIPIENI